MWDIINIQGYTSTFEHPKSVKRVVAAIDLYNSRELEFVKEYIDARLAILQRASLRATWTDHPQTSTTETRPPKKRRMKPSPVLQTTKPKAPFV